MKIDVVTGKRGGYEAMRPMFRAMTQDGFFAPRLIVCEQHRSQQHGWTYQQCAADFPEHCFMVGDNQAVYRQTRLSSLQWDLYNEWRMHPPDLVFLYGDRAESLVAAEVALRLQLPIAHSQGGDITGTQDDIVRNMLTKAANLHFVSTEDAHANVLGMGEDHERIFLVGDQHIDSLVEWKAKGLSYGPSDDRPDIIVLQHPDASATTNCYDQMLFTMSAVAGFQNDYKIAVIRPCSDYGSDNTNMAINAYKSDKIAVYDHVEQGVFYGWLSTAQVLVGNSSCGVIEAPYFGIPTINIGDRQRGRLQAGQTHNTGYDALAIEGILKSILAGPDCYEPERLYGDGSAWKHIIEALKHPETPALLRPKRCY